MCTFLKSGGIEKINVHNMYIDIISTYTNGVPVKGFLHTNIHIFILHYAQYVGRLPYTMLLTFKISMTCNEQLFSKANTMKCSQLFFFFKAIYATYVHTLSVIVCLPSLQRKHVSFQCIYAAQGDEVNTEFAKKM